MTILEAALLYAESGLSVIPIRSNVIPPEKLSAEEKKKYPRGKPDKRPLGPEWASAQKKRASIDEIKAWWKKWPSANVGIVMGEISGALAVDADSVEAITQVNDSIPDGLIVPCERTPRGGKHYIFAYEKGFVSRAEAGGPGIDVKTDGGYIICAPSTYDGHGSYRWEEGLSITDIIFLPALPSSLSLLIKDSFKYLNNNTFNNRYLFTHTGENVHNEKCPQMSTMSKNVQNVTLDVLFSEGGRDDGVFHVAHCLIKGGMKPELAMQVTKNVALCCNPPFPENEAETKVKSAIERAIRKERNLTSEIREYIETVVDGDFRGQDVDKALNLWTNVDKQYAAKVLKRLSEGPDAIIKKKGTRNGSWTTIDHQVKFMDFINVDLNNTVPLILPLGIHKKTVFFPKSVIVLAGVSGFGKTTFALNVVKDNMDRFETFYFNAEMSPEALHRKLTYFGISLKDWRMKAVDGWDFKNLPDQIAPNALNVVDYLEPEGDKPYGIHGVISDVINKLDKGVALITVQKRPNSDLGTGGIYSVKAASLALSLDWGTIKIFKNRFREEDPRPDLNQIDFDIVGGSIFQQKDDWYDSRMGKLKKKYREFEGGS